MPSPSKRYFPISLDVEGRRALVVGGDREALDKTQRLLASGALVTVVAAEVLPELAALAARTSVHWYARAFTEADVRGCQVVILSERNSALAAELRALGRHHRFLFCAIDQPEFCEWIHPAVVQAGPISVALGSGGSAPGLLKRMKNDLAEALDARFVAFAERLSALRQGLQDSTSDDRRRVLEGALDGFGLEVRVRYPAWEAEGDSLPDPSGFRSLARIAGKGSEG